MGLKNEVSCILGAAMNTYCTINDSCHILHHEEERPVTKAAQETVFSNVQK
jgi:hypothetical protein